MTTEPAGPKVYRAKLLPKRVMWAMAVGFGLGGVGLTAATVQQILWRRSHVTGHAKATVTKVRRVDKANRGSSYCPTFE